MPQAPGCERAPYFVTHDVELARKRSFTPRCKNDQFFVEHNRDYQKGRYLGICTKVTWTKMILGMLKTLWRVWFVKKVKTITPKVTADQTC